jgi:hypothetical protein
MLMIAWGVTVPQESVPRTIIPFSDLRKYRQWLDDYHPARLQSGQAVSLTVQQEDVQKLAILLASTQSALAHTQFQVTITPELLHLQAWYPIRLANRFLPLQFGWHPNSPFVLQRLGVSGLMLPVWIVDRLNRRLAQIPEVRDAERFWQELSPVVVMGDGDMLISTEWNDPELTGWISNFAPFWSDDRQRERLFEEVRWVAQFFEADDRRKIPLRDLMIALVERPDIDFDQDSAAVFGALTYATLGSVSGLRPGTDLPRLPNNRLILHGRYDLARHFTLAMWLGTQMSSDSVLELATYKEWSDAETRSSGFSAEDMVANVAGLVFLEYLQQASAEERKDFQESVQSRV